jgi:hypothetical protein
VTVLTALREVQIPLLATMLLAGSGTKLVRVLRTGSGDANLGPTVLFPVGLRRPVALILCTIEGAIGLGLIVTAGGIGAGSAAMSVRLAACLFFLVATCALVELRATRPEVGCGCFGDFSTAPVSSRTLARSALFALAALSTLGLQPLGSPASAGAAILLLAILFAELLLLGALSPEIGEGLIRLGYSEPCELRDVPSQRTLLALRRSRQWRRYSALIVSATPADVWRELCWRYVVYPARYQGLPADVVFAVFLQPRRPAIHAALVDAATGKTLPWPIAPAGGGRFRPGAARVAARLTTGVAPGTTAPVRADIPVSTDV